MGQVEETSRRKKVRGLGREPVAPSDTAAVGEGTVCDSEWNCWSGGKGEYLPALAGVPSNLPQTQADRVCEGISVTGGKMR